MTQLWRGYSGYDPSMGDLRATAMLPSVGMLCLCGVIGLGDSSPDMRLLPKAFTFPPLSDTKPRGWLHMQSRIQADTLCGHLEYFFVNNSLWMKDYKNLSTVPYPQKDLETVPYVRTRFYVALESISAPVTRRYWLNGMLPLAYQLNDSHLLNVSHEYISAILNRQEPSGWAGPAASKSRPCRSPWPRYRLLTVLASYAELFPEDTRTVGAMHRLVHALVAELKNITATQQLMHADGWAHAR